MIEVLWHGRGGQGAFTAARLLGAAASLVAGRYAVAFPSFGPERRGAPMRAFTKIADAAIGDRSAVVRADFVVYLDDTLLDAEFADELKPDGKVLVNSVSSFADERIIALDADGISRAILGREIPNTAFLGALSVLCKQIDVAGVKEAVRHYMPEKLHQKNLAIVDESIRVMSLEKTGKPSAEDSVRSCGAQPCKQAPIYEQFTGCLDSREEPETPGDVPCSVVGGGVSRNAVHIPSLKVGELNPEVFARSTCFEAGYLTTKNAGWRNVRPVVDEVVCTGCVQCYRYCPDGAIFRVAAKPDDKRRNLVVVDYDFCKGCGVCSSVCSVKAIKMVSEKESLSAEISGVNKGEGVEQ